MARGLVYTAVIGDYDKPKPVTFREPGVDYVMVTDGKGAKGWETQRPQIKGTPRETARRIKVTMPLLMERHHYRWFLWVDGTMQIVGSVTKFVEAALEQHDFAAWKHPWWQCSYTEIDKCIALKKDKKPALEKARRLLELGGFPHFYGQLATWVLLRKNTDLVRTHATEWWKDMVLTTMRDQVTFMFNLWRLEAKIQWLPGTIDQAKWLKFHRGHKR